MAFSSDNTQRELILTLIHLYKERTYLYDRNHEHYSNRKRRQQGIDEILREIRKYNANAQRLDVMKKIENLRASYRRQKNKSLESPDVEPKLWFFKHMRFLDVDSADSMDGRTNKSGDASDAVEYLVEDSNLDDDEDDDEEFLYPARFETSIDNPISVPDGSFSDRTQEENRRGRDDEYDAIGVIVAAKLRKLPPRTRILAEKMINDVLYHAQMDHLTTKSSIFLVAKNE